jgi:selenocysteine lyase/cysteine desulfurase
VNLMGARPLHAGSAAGRAAPLSHGGLRALVTGAEAKVPVLGGGTVGYVNFDNAASTPPFRSVLGRVNRFADWYSNVHRGTGFKSRLSTQAYEDARAAVSRFVGADPERDVVLFTRNTTSALNLLARRLTLPPGSVVLTTEMEHHSNDLPWRRVAPVVRVRVGPDGAVDEGDLRDQLERYSGRVALLAVTGASNVTGIINPVHRYAAWAHAAGARIVVDAAQLAPHGPIDMGPAGDPEHLDFVAFSAHKMYAPFGVGVLVGHRDAFHHGEPFEVGGGTVDVVGETDVTWADLPDREEAGTPCILGAVALHAAIRTYGDIGWAAVTGHEAELTTTAMDRMVRVRGLTLYASEHLPRFGVLTFNLAGLPHGLVAAILSHEWGIGSRSGCFCAQGYIRRLLGVGEDRSLRFARHLAAGDRSERPGAVRVSFGLSNTLDDVARFLEALTQVAAGRYARGYRLDPVHGDFYHPDLVTDYDSCLGF